MVLSNAKTEIDLAFTRKKLKGLSYENAFGGSTSFLRRRYTKDLSDVDIAITGVPFDQAVTNRPGARFGPRAIREASTLQTFDPPYGWDFDPMQELNIVDYGDLAFDYAKVQEFPSLLEQHILKILENDVSTIVLGGDHFITYPILKAYFEKLGEPLSLLQFDAHSDTWPDEDEDRIDHGTMFYKAVKSGIIDPTASAQVGIRTTNEDTLGVNIIDAREVHETGPVQVAKKIKSILGKRPTYLSFDIDCLDPAYAPGTGTPEIAGMTTREMVNVLRGLSGLNLISADVVEVSPAYDHAEVTSLAAATIVYELTNLFAKKKQ